jgi:hypothetical protein
MPVGTWDHAIKYSCLAGNFAIIDGESSYMRRHEKSHFKGIQAPYGALIHFLPPKTLKEKMPAFGPNAVEGVFIGWHMHPGGYWSRDYLVGYLPDFVALKRGEKKKAHVYRVRDIVFDEDKITFPMLDVKEGADMTKVRVEINVEEEDTRVPETKNVEKAEEKPEESKEGDKGDEDVGRGNATTGDDSEDKVEEEVLPDAPKETKIEASPEEDLLHFTKIEARE